MSPQGIPPCPERGTAHLELVQRIAQLGLWESCAGCGAVDLSGQACVLLGLGQAPCRLARDAFLALVDPGDRECLRTAIDATLRHGAALDSEVRIVQPSGQERYLRLRAERLRDAPAACVGTVQDVTEPRQSRRKAQQDAMLLQIASRIAHMGGWVYEPATRRVAWSDEVSRIHGLPSGTSLSVEEAIGFYAPESRGRIRRLFETCLHDGIPYDEELQMLTAAGRRIWVRAIGEPVRAPDGAVVRVQGAIQDISERWRAQQQTRQLARRLTATLDSITDAFYTLDRQWRFTYLNKQAERLFKRPRGELLGKVMWDEFGALKGEVGHVEFDRALRENRAVVFEEYYAPFQMWSEVRAYPFEEGLAVYFRDITEARKSEESLRVSEERFRIVARSTTDVVWDWDLGTGLLWCSENTEAMFGYTQEEISGPIEAWLRHVHENDRERVMTHLRAAIEGKDDQWIDEYAFVRKNGSPAVVLDRGYIIRDQAGKAVRVVGAMVDLTERRAADARIREQASLLDKAKDAIVVRGLDNRIYYWNKGAERLYGWTAEEAVGRQVEELLYDDPGQLRDAMRHLLEEGEWSGEMIERRKDGTMLSVEAQWTLMRDQAGRPQSIFAIKTDISERKEAERRVQYLAFYDPLTQLPNRHLLTERLQQAIAACARNGCVNALLFVDLDNFKTLNDTLGHSTGDLLLEQVAQRLAGCVSHKDIVARFGGDEFVIVLQGLSHDPERACERARAVGERILKALSQPYQLGNARHSTTASIGIALFRDGKDDAGELLKRADMAMYQAKAAGRNTLRFFDPGMAAALSRRMALEEDLRQALRERSLLLHYQPQVNRDGVVTGVEALVRWRHPSRGPVSPTEFIPLAEETGLMLPLGQWVMEAACAQLSNWARQPETARVEVAVNVSARQFHHPGFVGQVLDVLGPAGADPRRLKLELTETSLLEDVEDSIAKMKTLKAQGITFAIDDFGTGYSSLAYLKQLPLDMLKIDRSFVLDLLTNPNDAAIARTIIALGRNLGLRVLAEGVESEAQRDFLFEHGCEAYQGFLYTPALPADDVAAMLGAVRAAAGKDAAARHGNR